MFDFTVPASRASFARCCCLSLEVEDFPATGWGFWLGDAVRPVGIWTAFCADSLRLGTACLPWIAHETCRALLEHRPVLVRGTDRDRDTRLRILRHGTDARRGGQGRRDGWLHHPRRPVRIAVAGAHGSEAARHQPDCTRQARRTATVPANGRRNGTGSSRQPRTG